MVSSITPQPCFVDQQRGVVLMRDILQASMREERQDARFAGYLQIFRGSDDVDGVDRPTGEAIQFAEDLQWADEVELIDRRHDDHNDASGGGLERLCHRHQGCRNQRGGARDK